MQIISLLDRAKYIRCELHGVVSGKHYWIFDAYSWACVACLVATEGDRHPGAFIPVGMWQAMKREMQRGQYTALPLRILNRGPACIIGLRIPNLRVTHL